MFSTRVRVLWSPRAMADTCLEGRDHALAAAREANELFGGGGGDDEVDDEQQDEEVPAPSIAEVDACRYSSWHRLGNLSAHTFDSVTLLLPRDFVEHLLADGLLLAAGSEAMPARVRPDVAEQMESGFNLSDEEETEVAETTSGGGGGGDGGGARGGGDGGGGDGGSGDGGGGGGSGGDSDSESDSDGGVGEARSFPELEAAVRAAIDSLGGAVMPKFTWSAPKAGLYTRRPLSSTTASRHSCGSCGSVPEITLSSLYIGARRYSS